MTCTNVSDRLNLFAQSCSLAEICKTNVTQMTDTFLALEVQKNISNERRLRSNSTSKAFEHFFTNNYYLNEKFKF